MAWTLAQAASRVREAITFSIRLNHLPPLAPRALPRFRATMEALTPRRRSIRRRGLPDSRHLTFRAFRRQPPPAVPPSLVLRLSFSAAGLRPSPSLERTGLGFAIQSQARHGSRPNRVRHPADCSSASGCSPPRLAATQLPSAAGLKRRPGRDLHPSDLMRSQAHDCGSALPLSIARDPPGQALAPGKSSAATPFSLP